MINLNYFLFSRNNYYSGKLLTANDFEAEQKYNNDKRRLSNRLVSGFGVVCGLDVVAVSNDTVSVETGMAIDGYGREMVLAEPLRKRLDEIKGYNEVFRDEELFLFAEYSEKLTEPAQTAAEKTQPKMNKVSEGCSLYFAPFPALENIDYIKKYYRSETVFFSNEDIMGVISTPLYIKAGGKFILYLRFIPRDTETNICFKAKINLTCVRYQLQDYIDVNFTSTGAVMKNGVYSVEYICSGMNISDDMAVFEFSEDGFDMEINAVRADDIRQTSASAVISDNDTEEQVIENYSSDIMDYVMHNPCRDICLAKIRLSSTDPCIIGKINILPFHQRVYTNTQLALSDEIIKNRLDILSESIKKINTGSAHSVEIKNETEITHGETVINIGIGGKAGKRFFSGEISHGLGIGNVTVIVGQNTGDSEHSTVYGSGEIFDEDMRVKAETAAKVNNSNGTFVIGVRLLESTSDFELPVSWTAIRRKQTYEYGADKKIIIDVGARSLKIMESVYFSVKFVNMRQTAIHWSVDNESCGTINNNGYYTAPNHPGVYEIKAVCANDERIFTSAFVVVKP